ncbi:MAG: NADH-quinone oxidoreductase subunit J [Candidatus Latescibacterota bacterium]|nr:NADH-quinone oxidoreductase subunit J [Candidatus Latescibacterota bacterium]
METVVFFAMASLAVVCALLLISFRNPIYCALSLVGTLFSVAGIFVLLDAHFLAAVQIIVYAGAIMVLFLFVIMLLNLGSSESLEKVTGRYRFIGVVFLSTLLVAHLGLMALRHDRVKIVENEELATNNIPYLGKLLYTDFLLPFEVVSMILLVALIGVVVLVKREPNQTAG